MFVDMASSFDPIGRATGSTSHRTQQMVGQQAGIRQHHVVTAGNFLGNNIQFSGEGPGHDERKCGNSISPGGSSTVLNVAGSTNLNSLTLVFKPKSPKHQLSFSPAADRCNARCLRSLK